MLFAYDAILMRPGCVPLQAALGGNIATANRFPIESWLLTPTPSLRLYDFPDKNLKVAIELAWIYVKTKTPFKEAE